MQLTIREYKFIAKTVIEKNGCNMLLFGVGLDSKLWMKANKKGKTFFLENSIYWLPQIRTENPAINGQLIKNNTSRKDLEELLEALHVNLMITLPAFMKDIVWDIIFVDGPARYNDSTPGRMQSIYTWSVLSKESKHIDIFVHDRGHGIEKVCYDQFFCNLKLVVEFDRLRHYKNPLISPHLPRLCNPCHYLNSPKEP